MKKDPTSLWDRIFFKWQENILDFTLEQRCDLESQRQAGIIFACLERIDCLAADIQQVRQLGL